MKTGIDILIAQKVREIREREGLTKEQLDIKLGFAAGSSFVGHVETDKRTKLLLSGKTKKGIIFLSETYVNSSFGQNLLKSKVS